MSSLGRYVNFLECITPDTLSEIDLLYAEKVDFKDPINEAHDREHLKRIEADLFKQLKEIQFEVVEREGDDQQAFLRWVMRYRFRFWRREIEGVSYLKFDSAGKICFQRDYWDPSMTVYGEFPPLGLFIKGIKKLVSIQ